MTISLYTQRVFHGTTDISVQVSDFRTSTVAVSYTAGQYIYVGSPVPFNNLWIDMSSVSASNAGTPVVEVRWGQAWHSAVDIIDGTNGMQAVGRISWALNRLKGWDIELDSSDVGLTGTYIHNRYWLRLSWASNFTATFQYIGQKFSNDTVLRSYYPDLLQSALLTGFQSGKTSWDDQHYIAAEHIFKDLQKRGMILNQRQVFDWSSFEEASCHRVACIVYQAFGKPYADNLLDATKRYEADMGQRQMNIDTNMDGHLSEPEEKDRQGWMTR